MTLDLKNIMDLFSNHEIQILLTRFNFLTTIFKF